MIGIASLFFGLSTWLGLYLLARDGANPLLRWTGAGLLVYALVLASQVIRAGAFLWPLLMLGALAFVLDIILARRMISRLGEAFWPDFLRSLDAALLAVLLFGGPVLITMVVATGASVPMRWLLLVNITLAVATQVFATRLQTALDWIAFAALPQLRQVRADLRATADALPRANEAVDIGAWDSAELVRHTRRALGHYGDLPRLATNPLIQLPVIEARLAARQVEPNTLERAAELKRLLLEAIVQLKPPANEAFSPSDAWRHYNALYFPYVLGLKPYSQRTDATHLDHVSRQALDWLRTQVPERTLYNWQNAAARLVAQFIIEAGKQ
ncbi:MAG: hypothetical protein M3Q45_10960 [Chloroflexota bacterium]|nr:hypothetical protein [Chloroflexota bacterium]